MWFKAKLSNSEFIENTNNWYCNQQMCLKIKVFDYGSKQK